MPEWSTGGPAKAMSSARECSNHSDVDCGIFFLAGTEPKQMNAVDMIIQAPELSTLLQLLQMAGLVEAIRNLRGSTIFAPTNEAFAKLPTAQVQLLTRPDNREVLKQVLLTHVVPVSAKSGDLYNGQELRSLSGSLLDVNI